MPALRSSASGPAIAPVDLALDLTADGHVRDVEHAITATEVRKVFSLLSDRAVTAIFDASQISARQLQRPAHAAPALAGFVRSVEANVDLAPEISEATFATPSPPIDPGRNLILWLAAAGDQWALVDKRDGSPQGVFTHLFIDALRANGLVSRHQGQTNLADLKVNLTAESDRFCEANDQLCWLGLSPQLIAPEAALQTSIALAIQPAGTGARSLPVIQNPAGLSLDVTPASKPGDQAVLTVTAQKSGYLIVVRLLPNGRMRQIYPDLDHLAAPVPDKNKAKRSLKDINLMAPGQPVRIGFDPIDKSTGKDQGGGILVAMMANQPVQAIDLPEQPLNASDAAGSLVFIHDYARGLKVPGPNGTLQELEWSFDALGLADVDGGPMSLEACNL